MTNVTELPESDDNSSIVKLIKEINHAIYNYSGELSDLEIVGALELSKHQLLFDGALEQVEWKE